MEFKNRTIDLFGVKYKIKFIDTCATKEGEFAFGTTNLMDCIISISTRNNDGKPLNSEIIELTLIHEIVHAILAEGCYQSCCEDEPLVEWIAKCIKSLLKQKII